MRMLRDVILAAVSFVGLAAWAGPTVLYVSELGDKRIAVYTLDETSGELTRTSSVDLPGTPGTLAMARDRRHLYAVVRTGKQIATLPTDSATGRLGFPVLAPAGIDPAYLHVDRSGRWLLAASHSEGVVSSSRLINGVVTGEPVVILATGKYAHSIQTDPANRHALVPHVRELSKVEQLRFDPTTGLLSPNTPRSMAAGPGRGPRYLQFHPNGRWVYFVNEQGRSVSRCDYDARTGTLELRETVSTLPEDGSPPQGSCADIQLSADGRFAYASNRGRDSLAIFSIDPRSGRLAALGHAPTEKTPHSFCLVPGGERFVVAAGFGSNRLLVFRRDPETGALTALKAYDCGQGPVSVLAVKHE